MDTHKENSIPISQLRDEIAPYRVVVGAKQLRKALAAGKVRRAFLAKNADPALTQPLFELCSASHVPCAWVKSMTDLGYVCGIEVGAAAAAAVE